MLRFRPVTAAAAAIIGVATLGSRAAEPVSPASVATVPVPQGLVSIWAGGERTAAERALALQDLIRQAYDSPSPRGNGRIGPALPARVASGDHFTSGPGGDGPEAPADGGSRGGPANGTDGESGPGAIAVPLPLPIEVWTTTVFGGRATPQTLLADILRSRHASLFYYGLFSLDDETRTWLAAEPALIREIVEQYASRFTLVAPAFRVSAGSVRPPGGDAARPGWESLAGAGAASPAEFLRALLARDGGRLAYFFGAMGYVPEDRLRLGLDLSAGPERRLAAVNRLYAVFERLADRWVVDEAPFWRPTLDPALLLADLAADEVGVVRLPGTTAFWREVFADDEPSRADGRQADLRTLVEGEPIDFATLCELLARRDAGFYQRKHHQVLFASRHVRRVTPESARDAVDAIRAAGSQPALVGTLERAGVRRVSVFARAARRAAAISGIRNERRAARALRQFQGALFVLARAALRGSLPSATFERAVDSLNDLPLGAHDDYDGRLAPWFAGVLDAQARVRAAPTSPSASACRDPFPGVWDDESLDLRLLRLLAGDSQNCPTVEWEGTRYRVDFAWAEGTRLLHLLGAGRRPYLAAAAEAVRIAGVLSRPSVTAEDIRRERAALETLVGLAAWEPETQSAIDDASSQLQSRRGARAAARLRAIADDLLARGLTHLVYAAALGHPDRVIVSAGEAAARHDHRSGHPGAASGEWRLPFPVADGTRDWHMAGALLGLDISLAEFSLVSVSRRPPTRPPAMNETDRRTFVEAVALTESAALAEADAATIIAALRRGRERVAAVRTRAEAIALADEAGFSAARRTLLAWTMAHDPEHVAIAFAPVDLFRLGLQGPVPVRRLDAWGAPAAARTGCLCLSLDAPRPWEVLAGRWAMIASAFPDLKLRLVELLAELDLPASLLAPVLAAATRDFVTAADPRSRHDRRALEAYVRSLRLEHLEQYLALLTTDGPLVPLQEGVEDDRPGVSAAGPSPRQTSASIGAGPSGARP